MTIPDNGILHGAYRDATGDLRLLDTNQNPRPDETTVDWAQGLWVGWAQVYMDPNGSSPAVLTRSKNVVGITDGGSTVLVTFNRDINDAVFMASLTDCQSPPSNSPDLPGLVKAVQEGDSGVRVHTYRLTEEGTQPFSEAPRSFSLLVVGP